jgi:hypothetical protein
VDYKDLGILKNESEEGRRLGFDGKVRVQSNSDLKVVGTDGLDLSSKRYILLKWR